jgi:hypothetical protein
VDIRKTIKLDEKKGETGNDHAAVAALKSLGPN